MTRTPSDDPDGDYYAAIEQVIKASAAKRPMTPELEDFQRQVKDLFDSILSSSPELRKVPGTLENELYKEVTEGIKSSHTKYLEGILGKNKG